jgi:hypothetical protein
MSQVAQQAGNITAESVKLVRSFKQAVEAKSGDEERRMDSGRTRRLTRIDRLGISFWFGFSQSYNAVLCIFIAAYSQRQLPACFMNLRLPLLVFPLSWYAADLLPVS